MAHYFLTSISPLEISISLSRVTVTAVLSEAMATFLPLTIISEIFALFPFGKTLMTSPFLILPDTIVPEKPLNSESNLFTH